MLKLRCRHFETMRLRTPGRSSTSAMIVCGRICRTDSVLIYASTISHFGASIVSSSEAPGGTIG